MKTKQMKELAVSEKITLRAGDMFRVTGGPYYVKRNESRKKVRVSMAAKGPFRFMQACERGSQIWIEAISVRDNSSAVLSLTKRRSILPGAMIPRPYVVVGLVSAKRAAKLEAKRDGKRIGPSGGGGRRRAAADAPAAVEGACGPAPAPVDGGRRAGGRAADAPAPAGGRRAANAVAAVLAGLNPIAPSGR
jgi:hypothetical protein